MTKIAERDNSSHLGFPLLTKLLVACPALCLPMDTAIVAGSSLGVMRIFEREILFHISLS